MKPPPTPRSGAQSEPSSTPPAVDYRAAAPELRVLGIHRRPTIHELGEASVGELLSVLFIGDDDPVLGILDGIQRDSSLIQSALLDEALDNRELVSMALCELASRARVASELYRRIRDERNARDANGTGVRR